MRLDYLCEMQLILNESQAQARPVGGEEGVLFALGSGSVAGERLRGVVRCANHARRRGDGAMRPDVYGVITTDDNAAILFHMQGLTPWRPSPEGPKGDQISWISFETDAASYHWLNDLRCVLEGVVHIQAGVGASGTVRVYACVNEMV
jgi:hypothetical protein